MKSHRIVLSVVLVVSIIAVSALAAEAQPTLTTRLVADGLSSPVYATSPPSDNSRLFIVERGGAIKVVRNDTLLSRPFLNISSEIVSGGEQGLLGLVFHPQYASNGYFFINYTNSNGDTHVERIVVSTDPDSADMSARDTLLVVDQPFSNHNAGMLAFGPTDGYLYIGLGDGGDANDPANRAQDPTTLLGKMLRIDINGALPYEIPSDNPYAGKPDTLDEIWAFGLRNPWRYAFDRQTADLYIADVGQGTWEEVSFQPASSAGGENYGWRLKEGPDCFIPSSGCDPTNSLVDPISYYSHGGSPFRCSITGGFVYRGCAIPDLDGHYLFADYCAGRIWSYRYVSGSIMDSTEWTSQLNPTNARITSFGQDAAGELYIVNFSNAEVLKIIPSSGEVDCPIDPCCEGQRGDLNGDGADAGPADLAFMVDFLFDGGMAPVCGPEGNVNGTGPELPDSIDLAYFVDYLFAGGAAPVACP